MKINIKRLFLFVIIILLTGCSGNYNLNINDDLSINEELELSVENKNNAYQKTLNIFENNEIDKENYDVSVSGNEVKISYKNKYNSIEEYISNSEVYHQLFNKIEYNKSNNYIDLYISENIKIKDSYTAINGSNLTDFDVLQINITNPYKIIYTNAEISNENTYTWTINPNTKNVKIKMQFKPTLDRFPLKGVIVLSVIIISSSILLFNLIRRFKKDQRI